MRVASAAYGAHRDNGHAIFKRGELALILATIDPETGEIHPYLNVGRAIADAIEYGWLDAGSYWGCLIVPAHKVRRGDLASKQKRCHLAERHDRVRYTNRSLSEGFDPASSTLSEGFTSRTAHSVRDSTLNPLSLILCPSEPTHDRYPGQAS